jgi:hypothetical protein
MTVDKQHGFFIFECSYCNDLYDSKEEQFFEALKRFKEEGWELRRNTTDTEWLHVCNECVKEKR